MPRAPSARGRQQAVHHDAVRLEQGTGGPWLEFAHPPVDLDRIEDLLDLAFPADDLPPLEQGGDLIQIQGVPLDREAALDGSDPVRLPEVGLRSGLIEAVHPPDQTLDPGNPVKNFAGDLEGRLQLFDSIE